MRIVTRTVLGLVALVLAALATVAAVGWHQGYRLYVVHTGSMSPALRPGDAVLTAPAPSTVHPGEIVTFTVRSGPDSVVTHRVVSVAGGLVRTQGDANTSPDPWTLHESQVVGAASAILPHAGYLLVYLKQPAGLASLVLLLIGLVLLWQMFFPAEMTSRSGTHACAPRESPTARRTRREVVEG